MNVISRDQPVIVIAHDGARLRVVNAEGRAVDVLTFASEEEYETWRAERASSVPSMEHIIAKALCQMGIVPSALPADIAAALAALSRLPRVPDVQWLARQWGSRRSFYRSWARGIGQSPQRFLTCARVLHCLALRAAGNTVSRAAEGAGFSSPRQFRQHAMRLKFRLSKRDGVRRLGDAPVEVDLATLDIVYSDGTRKPHEGGAGDWSESDSRRWHVRRPRGTNQPLDAPNDSP